MFQGLNKAGEKAANYLIKKGYDGVNNDDEEYIVFDAENIKSADPVTYDDAGNIIPLSERFNSKKKDIRYSLRYLPKKSLELGFSSHIMSLHAGENFDKSEYGLHTSYGDYEYFYDYLGDGDFEVLAMKPIEGTKASETIKDLNNAEKRRPENVSRNGDVWEANRERFIGTGSPDGTRGNSLSNDGLDSGLLENDKNNRPEEDSEKSNRTSEADTYFKTGADGTNRPRYEKRYSLKKAPIFFSNTLDAISTTKKLPAKQKVRSWLKTLPPFVEKNEDKWMGLTEWLKGKDPEESLTKEDILDYVRTHDVEMVEVNYSKDGHRNIGENPDYVCQYTNFRPSQNITLMLRIY